MRRPVEPPRCEDFSDCIANRKGRCMALSSNDFRRDCPFYKPRKEVKR